MTEDPFEKPFETNCEPCWQDCPHREQCHSTKNIIDLLEKAIEGTTLLPDRAYYRINPDKYNKAIALLKQQPPVGEFTKSIREKLGNDPDPPTAYHWERLDKYWLCRNLFKLCDHLDRSEASKAKLLGLCEEFMERADDGSAEFDDPVPGSIFLRAKAAIEENKE